MRRNDKPWCKYHEGRYRASFSVFSQGTPQGETKTDVCGFCLCDEVKHRLKFGDQVLVEKVQARR